MDTVINVSSAVIAGRRLSRWNKLIAHRRRATSDPVVPRGPEQLFCRGPLSLVSPACSRASWHGARCRQTQTDPVPACLCTALTVRQVARSPPTHRSALNAPFHGTRISRNYPGFLLFAGAVASKLRGYSFVKNGNSRRRFLC